MYPSSSINGNNNNPPMSCIHDHTIFPHNSKHHDQEDYQYPPSSFFHLPSPYIHYEDDVVFLQHLHDLLQQQPQPPPPPQQQQQQTTTTAEAVVIDSDHHPRKRPSSKKDRHSKINTAHGPRDRRMRLSLEVARKFFDLQDMLGFDKASKTVEWLLTKSKAAIKELARGGLPVPVPPAAAAAVQMKHSSCCNNTTTSSTSATSDQSCTEVVSGSVVNVVDHHHHDESSNISKKKPSSTAPKEIKRNARTTLRKSSFHHPLARESRAKARAWAKERTRNKKSKLMSNFEAILNHHHDDQLGVQEPPSRRDPEDLGTKQDILGHDSLVITGNWSPSIIFNYQHINTGILSSQEQHQSTDFQFCGKPWEAYSNMNLF